jgi:hypothetical protein
MCTLRFHVGLPLSLLFLAACPWIGAAEHRQNRERLDEADTDTDTDTDTHTGLGCVEDADEPNDTPQAAVGVELPATFDAAVCDGSPDHWSAKVLGTLDVFDAALACDGEAVLRVYHDGVLRETIEGACPLTSQLGMGAGVYVVGVTALEASLPYELTVETVECFSLDRDTDGQPPSSCDGGRDCDDDNDEIYVGALDVPGNGVDEDCDGVDDLVAQDPADCRASLADAVPAVSPLPCGAPDVDPVWHHFTFDVAPPASVEVFLTPTSGPADLFALYTDSGGRYGLDAGESELDDEDTCANAAYGDCPAACIRSGSSGGSETAHLWVAQRDCSGPVDYELRLKVAGALPTVNLEADVAGPTSR